MFSAVTVMVLLTVLEIMLAVCGVRPATSRDPFIGFAGYNPLFVEVSSPEGPVMETAANKRHLFNVQSFPRDKAPGTFRIFCLGGSTTYGHPYDDRTSFCGWLRAFLPAADPSRKWEVINAGGISYASYRVARLMEELVQYEPDLFIVYTGQNEFLERRTYGTLSATPSWIRNTAGLLAQTRTVAALQAVLSDRNPPYPPQGTFILPAEVSARLDSALGPEMYQRDDAWSQDVVRHYGLNLRRMAESARACGTQLVFVAPASNLADCRPFKSVHLRGLSPDQAATCDHLIAQAEKLLTADKPAQGLSLVQQALRIDGRFALAHQLHGRCLRALGKMDEARTAFRRARDEDVCPLRALSAMRPVLLDVARDEQIPLVDYEQMIDNWSAPEIPGSNWFLDHVHPTVEGHRRLALTLLDTMREYGWLVPHDSWNEEAIQAVTQRVEQGIDRAAQGRALVTLSKTLGWAGQREEAVRLALQAIELLPNDAAALYQAANAYYDLGELDQAEATYRRVLDVDARFASAWYGLGIVAADRDQPRQAIDAFAKAVRLDPQFGDAHYNLGNVLMSWGEFDRAETHFKQTLKLQPENFFACNNLGVIAANQNRPDEARQWFHRALAIEKSCVDAHVNLGRLYHERGDLQQAARHYRAALEQVPQHPVARALLDRIPAN